MSVVEVRIPDIGDAQDVEVIEICVRVGQDIRQDDTLIVIESDKASMEVPSPTSGHITSINSKLGDKVNTDDLVLTLEVEAEQTTGTQPAATLPANEGLFSNLSAENASDPAVVQPHSQPADQTTRVEIRVPDIGEAKDVVVIELLVAPGTSVAADDPLIVLESDKASMEITSSVDGVVETLDVTLDQPIDQGDLVATIRTTTVSTPLEAKPVERSDRTKPRPSVTESEASQPAKVDPNTTPIQDGSRDSQRLVYAGPAVRRLARELGVDLTQVDGTGSKGRILKDDVQDYVKQILTSGVQQASLPEVHYPDFTQFGAVELKPLSRIRTVGAQNLVKSWLNVVHVTQHDSSDVTNLESLRKQLNNEAVLRGEDIKLTPLPFIIRACVLALKKYPQFNASIHPSLDKVVLKKYLHIAFAVDTDEGLVVPVIRDADQKKLTELASEIRTLSDAARRRRLNPNQIAGASFTISSLGSLGGTGFTPIVNAPEVAILGVARVETQPRWSGQRFEARRTMPLSLSYDHRAINGAEGGRFLVEVCEGLRDVRRLV